MKNPQPAKVKRWKDPRAYAVVGGWCLFAGLISLVIGRLAWQFYEEASSSYIIYKGLGPYGAAALGGCLFNILGVLGLLAGLVYIGLALHQQISDSRGLHRAAEALGETVDAGNVEQLIQALEDENMYVRTKATEALGHMRNSRAVESLIQALEDKEGIVQRSAAKALGNIKDVRAVEPLIRALKDSDVQAEAARVLGELGDARAIEPLVHTLKDRGAVGMSSPGAMGEALVRFGEQAVGPLIQTLEDSNVNTRRAAAQILVKIGDARAVEPLVKALRDEDGFLRQFAAQALGKIGDARAVEPLVTALRDGDGFLRKEAAQALGEIGDARAVESLTRTLKDREDAVRIAARKALKRIMVSSSTLQSTSTPSSLEPAPVSTPTVQPVPAPPAVSYTSQPGTASMPQPSYPQSLYPAFAPRAPKDRSIALILEILPGLFGFLGFGWLYSGNTGTGIAWLIGVLVWEFIAIFIDVITGGVFCLCSVPINLVLTTISAYSLNKYTKSHPELFGA